MLPPQNLAAGRPASQSSTGFGGLAARAVDANTDGNWAAGSVTHTLFQPQPWWQVDLGAVYALGRVVLYNRTDCCGDRLADFDLLVSNDGASWTRVATHPGSAPATATFTMNASGRFVRVQLQGANYLSLAEVQVFPPLNLAAGKPASQSSTGFGGLAARAVDENTDGNWAAGSVTHTLFQARPWWQVDLGAVHALGQVVLYNRTDCCGDRLANFDVLVSSTGGSWTRVATYDGLAPARTAFALNASARFVRVQLRGSNYLSLAEVQVFPLQNLAAGRPASQSSTAFGGLASRAVDDNTNGNWFAGSVTHTAFQAQPWWQVDLGAVYALGQVVLYNRTDCCGNRLANFVVLVSNDGASWTVAATYGGVAPARTVLALNASARFVRVQLQGANYLSLAEVQVLPLQNLAAGSPTSQSSTGFGGLASRAVDGNTNGNWAAGSVTHTLFQAQPWWQVDLGAIYPLGRVVLYNRTDCCGDRLANFDVLVSNDGASWTVAATHAGVAPARTALALTASARFVRVQLQGTNYLSLAEVQVLPLQNLAAGSPTSQSSTGFGGACTRAVDGNTDGNWAAGSVTHTLFQAQPWWQVDLGAAYAVGQVVLYNRTDCCGDRLANFDILVSNDGFAWTIAASHGGVAPVRTAFALNASARFVRIRLQGTNYLSLAEVQVLPPQS